MTAINTKTHTDKGLTSEIPQLAQSLEIRYLPNGELSVRTDGASTAVHLRLCFPWSEPNRYVSLRDQNNNEVAMITELNELDERSRESLEQALAEGGFVFEIESVQSLETEFEIRNWKVTTSQGPCTFQTELDEWPRQLADGGLLIKDVAGNLYRVRAPKTLGTTGVSGT